MKKVDASCWIEILCTCPYCGEVVDIFDDDRIKESMGNDHRVEECNIEIICSECKKTFIVENINF